MFTVYVIYCCMFILFNNYVKLNIIVHGPIITQKSDYSYINVNKTFLILSCNTIISLKVTIPHPKICKFIYKLFKVCSFFLGNANISTFLHISYLYNMNLLN